MQFITLFISGNGWHRLIQEDRTPKKVFVLGVYASAVHARWMKDGKVKCAALIGLLLTEWVQINISAIGLVIVTQYRRHRT